MNERISLKLNMKDGTLDFEGSPHDLGDALQHIERFMQIQARPNTVISGAIRPQLEMFPVDNQDTANASNGAATVGKVRTSKKAKLTLQMDKTLALDPPGKISAIDFAASKKPTSADRKCLAAVYYLQHVLELTAIGAPQVYTFFKAVSWEMPADLVNKLQVAGSHGWLDTSNSQSIRTTPIGETEVEHRMPAGVKKA